LQLHHQQHLQLHHQQQPLVLPRLLLLPVLPMRSHLSLLPLLPSHRGQQHLPPLLISPKITHLM
ncbi:MAG: hypothetical protein ACK559_14755, partial [bacterium]